MSVAFIHPYLALPPGQAPQVNASGIKNQWIMHTAGVGGTAYAGYEHNQDGKLYKVEGTNISFLENWLTQGPASAFEVRALRNTGTLAPGSAPTETWLTAAGNHQWFVRRTSGVQECEIAYQIRDKATQTLQAFATIILTADVT